MSERERDEEADWSKSIPHNFDITAEDLENFEDLNFLVVAYQRASEDG